MSSASRAWSIPAYCHREDQLVAHAGHGDTDHGRKGDEEEVGKEARGCGPSLTLTIRWRRRGIMRRASV